ncbi:hypothetical protein ACHAPA_007889 [Fusarium lateritium]
MGDENTFCALCGAPAHRIMIRNYDPRLIGADSAEWLNSINLIGRGREKNATAFFTGLAEYSHYKCYNLESVPHSLEVKYKLRSNGLHVYERTETPGLLVSFHLDCYSILEKVAAPRVILPTGLHETFDPHCTGRYAFGLDYDYGDASSCQKVAWKCVKGMEYLAASPVTILYTEEFIESIVSDSELQKLNAQHSSSPK